MANLFHWGNHVFVVASVSYCVADLLRGFVFASQSEDSKRDVQLNVVYLLLSICFVVDSLIYLKAFLLSYENDVSTLNAVADNTFAANSKQLSVVRTLQFLLTSEIGLAYMLNLIPSVGYLMTSVFPFFLDPSNAAAYKTLDKAEVIIDTINMIVFTFDALLFLHLCIIDLRANRPEPNICADKRLHDSHAELCFNPAASYLLANALNVAASALYAAFNIWALNRRFQLNRQENEMIASGQLHNDKTINDFYFTQLNTVTTTQCQGFFAADLLYVLCAIALEWAAYRERKDFTTIHDSAAQLPVNEAVPALQQLNKKTQLNHHLGRSRFSQQHKQEGHRLTFPVFQLTTIKVTQAQQHHHEDDDNDVASTRTNSATQQQADSDEDERLQGKPDQQTDSALDRQFERISL